MGLYSSFLQAANPDQARKFFIVLNLSLITIIQEFFLGNLQLFFIGFLIVICAMLWKNERRLSLIVLILIGQCIIRYLNLNGVAGAIFSLSSKYIYGSNLKILAAFSKDLAYNSFAVLITLVLLVFSGSSVRSNTLEKKQYQLLVFFSIALSAACFIYSILSAVKIISVQKYFYLFPMVFVTAASIAIKDEIYFRKIMIDSIGGYINNACLANIFQAFYWALWHFFYGFPNGLTGFAVCFIGALVWGNIYIKTGKIIIPLITHFAIEICGFYILYKDLF